jgi:outer membrane receptor protein involved in Fe transport
VRLSSLFEYRKESYADATQEFYGLTALYPGRSTSVKSVYLEGQIPLVSARNRRRGIEALEVQLAARIDDYHVLGKTGFVLGGGQPVVSATNDTRSVNPTLAIRYQPLPSVAMRLSYGTGFVPPDAIQLAPAVTSTPITVSDPKRGGASTTLPVGSVIQGGNPDLDPEKSKSLSVGVVLTPQAVPGLRLSLDYTHLKKTDNIAVYPTGSQGIVNDEDLLPGRVERGPNLAGDLAGWAGPITRLDLTLFNIAKAEVDAFDLQFDFTRATSLGTFRLSTVATAQTHYKTKSLSGQPMFENVGFTFEKPQKYTGSAELGWERADWAAGWVTRYYHSYMTQDPAVPGTAGNIQLQGHGGLVPSQIYHDLYVTWRPGHATDMPSHLLEGVELQLGLRNIFDRTPPFDAFAYSLYGMFHSPLGDPLGRNYQLSLTKRF